jgi:KUP system potassium uptake protein
MEKFLSQDNDLPFWEQIMMKIHFMIRGFSLSEEKAFGLDTSNVVVEKFPLVVVPVTKLKLKRIRRPG